MNEYHTFLVEVILAIGSVITSIASCIAAWHGIRNAKALTAMHTQLGTGKMTDKPFTGETEMFFLPVKIGCEDGRIVEVDLTDAIRRKFVIQHEDGSLSMTLDKSGPTPGSG